MVVVVVGVEDDGSAGHDRLPHQFRVEWLTCGSGENRRVRRGGGRGVGVPEPQHQTRLRSQQGQGGIAHRGVDRHGRERRRDLLTHAEQGVETVEQGQGHFVAVADGPRRRGRSQLGQCLAGLDEVVGGTGPTELGADDSPGEQCLGRLLAGALALGDPEALVEATPGRPGAAPGGGEQGGLPEGVGEVVGVTAGHPPGPAGCPHRLA